LLDTLVLVDSPSSVVGKGLRLLDVVELVELALASLVPRKRLPNERTALAYFVDVGDLHPTAVQIVVLLAHVNGRK
jgi:hypothetical protein